MHPEYVKSRCPRQNAKGEALAERIPIGLVCRLFGCRHANMSRPFTYADASYRACLKCGARRDFDPQTLRTFGSFYYQNEGDAERGEAKADNA